MAGDLPGPGLPRPDSPHARPDRPAEPPAAVRSLRRPAAPHSALDVAVRPERGGGARSARPAARRARPRDDLGLLLRARERGGPSRLLAARPLLGGARGAARASRLPRLLRRG